MNNLQQPVRVIDSFVLNVHKIFSTIQGEGPFVGRPATFIRLSGCNLQCPLCDTDYTSVRLNMEFQLVAGKAMELGNNLIVITGGEPYRQNIKQLVNHLVLDGFLVQIETNGTLYHKHTSKAIIVCSPKESYIDPDLARAVNYFKYVLHYKHVGEDGLPTIALANKTRGNLPLYRPDDSFPREKIYLQPVDTGIAIIDQKNLDVTIASCREFGYTLCLQIHKIINLP